MRYVGQSYEVLTPIPDHIGSALDEVKANFHKAHLREYGVSSEEFYPAFVSLGVTALGVVAGHGNGDSPAISAGARKSDTENVIKGERDVIFDGKAIRTSLYDAAALRPGRKIEGPAIIEHEHSCTTLAPASSAIVDAEGNLSITV
jgi:N-methylhydantoinase A